MQNLQLDRTFLFLNKSRDCHVHFEQELFRKSFLSIEIKSYSELNKSRDYHVHLPDLMPIQSDSE